MPPRGYRDETKGLVKSIDRGTLELVRLSAKTGHALRRSITALASIQKAAEAAGEPVERLNVVIAEHNLLSAKLRECEEQGQRYKKELADRVEHRARTKAAYGRERDLRHLVRMALLQACDDLTAWAAAGEIADEIAAEGAQARYAVQKRLHHKFQQAPALYRRLALAGGDPAEAARREIDESLSRWNARMAALPRIDTEAARAFRREIDEINARYSKEK